MPDEQGLADLTATEVARLIGSGDLSPVAVTEAALSRVHRYNPTLNAIVTLNDAALDEARSLEAALARGQAPGPLCGVPVGIKDVTPVAGLRTTYGSRIFADHVAEQDALVVERLRAAGAIIIGKTNTPEFAAGGNTFNEVFGRTRNPWDPSRSAGGSTGGGAAALAAGMIAIAEGTDLGGSLRIPASFCGVVGLRPSPGVVPTWPSAWLWDDLSVSGPMARTAQDVALALRVMAGPDPRVPIDRGALGRGSSSEPRERPGPMEEPTNGGGRASRVAIDGLRLAYVADAARVGIDAHVERVTQAATSRLRGEGADVEEVDLDLRDVAKAFLHLRGVWFATHLREHSAHLERLGDNVRGNVEAGLRVTTDQIAWANGVRGHLWESFEAYFRDHDFLLAPTMAVSPFPVEQNYPSTVGGRPARTYVDWIAPTSVFSMTGLPVASVPCGLDEDGLPVGLQVVGPPNSELRVLELCARIQVLCPIGTPPLDRLLA